MAKYLNQYQILFNKAKTDLSAARLLYRNFVSGNNEIDLEVVCFHLQQCAEKCLKAILSKNRSNFPKVHDLELLMNLVKQSNIELQLDNDLLTELNDFAVEGRYAILHDDLIMVENYFLEMDQLIKSTNQIIDR